MKVPWLRKATIAEAADELVADFQSKVGYPARPPIPVEDIIERGLELTLRYADLRRELGLDDVLGATYVQKRMICLDERLVEHTSEGRLSFTFAHEAGHWMLHRRYITDACRTSGSNSSIFCRVQDAKAPIEWQADYFASCLLMPERAVRDAFCQIYGSGPLILYNLKSAFCGPICFDPSADTWPMIAAAVKKAGGFTNVSKQAMIIRLQELGLVKNETGAKLSWKACFGMV
jgi:hypothetical protein